MKKRKVWSASTPLSPRAHWVSPTTQDLEILVPGQESPNFKLQPHLIFHKEISHDLHPITVGRGPAKKEFLKMTNHRGSCRQWGLKVAAAPHAQTNPRRCPRDCWGGGCGETGVSPRSPREE